MSRLLDRRLLQPDPPLLCDVLQTAVYAGTARPDAFRLRRLLSSPAAVVRARLVRPGGAGWYGRIPVISHCKMSATVPGLAGAVGVRGRCL
ncbi:hypothetical protein [Streptomyces sp. NBC_00989]|uniref:hypothetical protein n=1 Tax=Streptomyces sp. NBC_00989 TaxID=2903705 RepID=UPI0038700528|nr:hypothetical protein OG714_00110 [Streptomyces sp. NBC_00989]WSW98146.1 hypothetical protein OG714_54030 [Streptomyces sp. NBC_00989]